jgi:hypothetical protein
MSERVYITLKEASEHLQAKGLTGQTVGVLRTAVGEKRLSAVKDGRSWKTTLAKVEAYEAALWRKHDFRPGPGIRSRRHRPKNETRPKAADAVSKEESYRRAMAWAKGERPTWR